jgi:hypothetical protein
LPKTRAVVDNEVGAGEKELVALEAEALWAA